MKPVAPQSGLSHIGQILMPVKDLKRAAAFYREILGLKFLFDIADAAFFDCDGTRLMLSTPESPEFDHPGSVLYFKVNDLQSIYELLVTRRVQFIDQPHLIARMDKYDLWMAFFKDTEGNTLGLMSEVAHQV
jgi:predicted enzyme related to lactoylglutathione lyase